MISLKFVDTCSADYLTDHHSREGELLVGVPVDATTTADDVRAALADELTGADGIPSEITDDMIRAEIDATVRSSAEPWDVMIEEGDEYGESDVQAWFLLTWSEV